VTDPFAYVPFALAARGGSVDGTSAAQLTMAGVTLLRASAPLVRALHGKRSAILMPASAGFLTALAASDGRAAVLLDPALAARAVAQQLADANVGAVFTVQALAGLLPAGTVHVLLDEAPARAVVVAGETRREVALTGHEALRLDGDADEPGAMEPCVIFSAPPSLDGAMRETATHRELLAGARTRVADLALHTGDHVLVRTSFTARFGFTTGALAPLMAGARVTTAAHLDAGAMLDVIEREHVTHLVAEPAMFSAMLPALAQRARALRAPALRLAISGGAPLPPATHAEWRERTGVELRRGVNAHRRDEHRRAGG
jgi:acyl-coenzyme A synthetase/AMP-(fatty) acid ligase